MNNKIICSICGEEVNKNDLIPDRQFSMINGAVIGKYIEVIGHKSCVYNVDRIVLMENRLRLWSLIGSLKKQLIEERHWNEKIERTLTDLELVNPLDSDIVT